jgi:hypothetical protein
MTSVELVGEAIWRYRICDRNSFKLFMIPSVMVERHAFRDGTKRRFRVYLSDGRNLRGFCTVTSGCEIYMPAWLRPLITSLAWVEFEVIGADKSPKATLDWE